MIRIDCTARDAAANERAASLVMQVADVVPPQILASVPADGATEVPTHSSLSVSFDEPLAAESVQPEAVTLTDAAGDAVASNVVLSTDGRQLTVTPVVPLLVGQTYTLTVAATVTDLAGNRLPTPYVVGFATDASGPQIAAISPQADSTNVPVGASIGITYNEPLDPASLAPELFLLSSEFGPVVGSLSLAADGRTVLLKPLGQLGFSRAYTMTVTAGVRDLSGNPSSGGKVFHFTTRAPDADLVGLWPMDGDWKDASGNGHDLTARNGIVFSEDKISGISSAHFDGNDDYLINNPFNSFASSEITIEYWMKSDDPSRSATPVSYATASYQNELSIIDYKNIELGRSDKYLKTGVTAIDGNWHFIAISWRAIDGQVVLFKDGVKAFTGTLAGNPIASGGCLVFGRDQDSVDGGYQWNQNLVGNLDNVAIYKKVLSEEDVLEHYNAGLTDDRRPPAPPTVDAVASPTFNSTILLSGTKDAEASIRVNGRQIVGHDSATTWQAPYPLQPGQNILEVESRDPAGNRSDSIPLSVELLPANQFDPSIVGLWRMEKSWLDYSGNGNVLIPVNGASFVENKAVGDYSSNFNGGNYVVNTTPVGTALATNFTIVGWVNPRATQWGGIVDTSLENTGSWEVWYETNQSISYRQNWNRSQGLESVATPQGSVPLGEWTQFAIVYGDRKVTIYLNGIESVSKFFNNNPVFNGSEWLEFGVNRPGADEYYIGLLDDVTLYSRALPSGEIKSLYEAAPGITISSSDDLESFPPGQTGTASFVAIDPDGIVNVSCAAAQAASGSLELPVDPPQYTVSGTFQFAVAADALPSAPASLTCTAMDALGHVGSRTIPLTVADIVAPQPVGTSIADGATGVSATRVISVTFGEALSSSSVDGTTVTLTNQNSGSMVPGAVLLSADGKTITFKPATDLLDDTTYELAVDTGIADLAGNQPQSDFLLRFTTAPAVLITLQGVGTSNSPYVLASGRYGDITISNSYVVFDGLVIANSLSLSNGSVLTHRATGLSGEERLEIHADAVTIDGTSRIDVRGRGYLGSYRGEQRYYARTLGNTTSGGSYQGAGGSYGGWGNASNWSGTINSPYGDLSDPNEVGSGGSTASSAYGGGNGGGLLRLTAETLQVDGSINADGNAGYYGGGSGGGIRLDVGTLSGNGWITARGGSSSNTSQSGGAGGGGRMAIYYDSLSLTEDHLLAQGGQSGNGSRSDRNGGAGTIYLKSHAATMADVILDNQGIATNRTTTIPGGEYVSVTVRENARFTVQSDLRTEVPLTLTDATLTVSGGLTIPGDLNLTRSTLVVKGALPVPGAVTLTSSYLEVAGALQIDGDLSLSESSVLTHSAATTGSEYRLEVRAQNVTIDGTSRIDVSGRGYLGSYRGGTTVIMPGRSGTRRVGGVTKVRVAVMAAGGMPAIGVGQSTVLMEI